MARSISETQRVRYLLGLSSPAEREHIESEYFEDDDAFQEMLTTEDDLIDAYARGELAGEERRTFEQRFLNSSGVRDRVQFARVFARTVSANQSAKTKIPDTLLDIFKIVQSSLLLRTATTAAVMVFVAVFIWLVIDRTRMTNELRELRSESAELSRRTEALQRSSDTERTRRSEITSILPELPPQPDKPRHRERPRIATQRAGRLPEIKNDPEQIASNKSESAEQLINTQDATLGNSFETKVTTLPVLGRKFKEPPNTYSLIPGNASSTVRGTAKDPNGKVVSGATVTLTDSARNFTRTQYTNEDGAYVFNSIPPGTYSIEVQASGFKTSLASGLAARVDTPTVMDVSLELGSVSESVNVTSAAETATNTSDATIGNSFERKRITELPLNANNVVGLLSLQPGGSRTDFVNGSDQSNNRPDGVDATIRISNSLSWIRFQVTLETAATHDNYRVTIKTVDGRLVTSVDWIEPLSPNQNMIDTPAIATVDLPLGDYVLLLTGKEPDGSFVKIAEYSFKVNKY